jgi:RNA polymerase-binding transcription factor
MTTIDTTRFREALLGERERVVKAIENLRSENAASSEDMADEGADQHLADSATETYDRELGDTLEENSEQVLDDIDAALRRIDEGTYGTCTNCGKPISEERLEALPWASLCIDCARER